MELKSFENLEVWQQARKLVSAIYCETPIPQAQWNWLVEQYRAAEGLIPVIR
jgi:hypothetical protein